MNFIFLSYINRSGSTFLVNQLSKQKEFCVCPEAEILFLSLLKFPRLAVPLKKKSQIAIFHDKKFQQWKLEENAIERVLAANIPHGEKFLKILELFREQYYPQSHYIVFKHDHIFKLETFFKAKNFHWILLDRNVLDVYASQKNTISPDTGKVFCKNVLVFCMLQKAWRKQLQQTNLSDFCIVNYEEMMLRFEATWVRLLSCLQIDPGQMSQPQVPGRVSQFMTSEYQKMHRLIDHTPDPGRINSWKTLLSNFERYTLIKRLSTFTGYEKNQYLSLQKFIIPYISCLPGFLWFRFKFLLRKLRFGSSL